MNTNTAIGKGLKTLIWVAVSAAVYAALTYVTGNPELFDARVVALAGLINTALVTGKNVVDPNVKNI